MGHARWAAMRVTIARLGAGALLTGCATARISWDKSGITQAERERDENACLRACMEARGYTVRPR
jgi:hypothetical protein